MATFSCSALKAASAAQFPNSGFDTDTSVAPAIGHALIPLTMHDVDKD
jgi:hypothetical protein